MTDIIDSRRLPGRDGFDLRVELTPDDDVDPVWRDEQYTPEELAALNRDEWSFVVATVIASRAGVDLGAESLSGCEYGAVPGKSGWTSPTEDDTVNGYYDNLSGEAIAKAQEKLKELGR